MATYIDEKTACTIYAQFDIDSGRCTNHEIFKSTAVPAYVSISHDYDLILVSGKFWYFNLIGLKSESWSNGVDSSLGDW